MATSGADLFKTLVALPTPVLATYLVTPLFGRGFGPRGALAYVAAVLVFPALCLAWLWASDSWRVYRNRRLFWCVGFLLAAAVAFFGGALLTTGVSGATVQRFSVGRHPQDVVYAGDAAWISDNATDSVYRLPGGDPSRRRPFQVREAFELASDGTSVWVSTEAGSIQEMALDGQPIRSIEIPGTPSDIAVSEDAVWLAMLDQGVVLRVDRASEEETPVPVGGSPGSLAVGTDAVWVTDVARNAVLSVDRRTLAPGEPIDIGRRPYGITVDADHVWVASTDENSLTKLPAHPGEAADNGVEDVFTVPDGPTDVESTSDALWVISESAGVLFALRPDSGEVLGEERVGDTPIKITVHDDDVWVAVQGDGRVVRVPMAAVLG